MRRLRHPARHPPALPYGGAWPQKAHGLWVAQASVSASGKWAHAEPSPEQTQHTEPTRACRRSGRAGAGATGAAPQGPVTAPGAPALRPGHVLVTLQPRTTLLRCDLRLDGDVCNLEGLGRKPGWADLRLFQLKPNSTPNQNRQPEAGPPVAPASLDPPPGSRPRTRTPPSALTGAGRRSHLCRSSEAGALLVGLRAPGSGQR